MEDWGGGGGRHLGGGRLGAAAAGERWKTGAAAVDGWRAMEDGAVGDGRAVEDWGGSGGRWVGGG